MSLRTPWWILVAALLAAWVLMAGSAAAAVMVVGHDADPATCGGNAAAYSTIGSALTAASPGDTILVCPGDYPEQVIITTDEVTLRSQAVRAAAIRAPAVMVAPRALVRVSGATNVTLRDFTILDEGGCDAGCYGVWVEGGGSLTLEGNNILPARR